MPTSTRPSHDRFMKRRGKFAIAPRADRGVRPYRTFCVFAEHYTILRSRPAGESAASTPTDILRCCRSSCGFVGASDAGGAEPLPYAGLVDSARSPKGRANLQVPTAQSFSRLRRQLSLHKGAFTGAQVGSAYKKAAATRLPLYFTASGSWFYGRRRAGWRTFCCWSRT